jgi:hypothetical protein
MARGIKKNFSGGEVAYTVASRDELARYSSSCILMQNFVAQLTGGGRFRSGTKYVGAALGDGIMIPFEFNSEEEDMYQLVFTNLKLRFVQDDGFVIDGTPVEIASPYTLAQLPEVTYDQIGDTMYLAHTSHPPYKLVRTSHVSWTLTAVTFGAKLAAPIGLGLVWNGPTGSYQQSYRVTAVNAAGEESLKSNTQALANVNEPGWWVDTNTVDLSWTGVDGAESYSVYKKYQGYFGFIGIAEFNSFIDANYLADISLVPPIENLPFDDDNYPGAVAFHQQRLWFAGSNDNPATFNASQTANFENFNKSTPSRADDALEFTLASGRIDQIKWLTPFNDLLIGTVGAEVRVLAPDGGAVTPTNIDAKPQSFNGSGKVGPLIVGSSVLHVQRQGSTVRDLFYSLEKEGYVGNNLSVLADHLFDGHSIVSWAYQQTPDSVVWAVRDDGILIAMTYLREHEIWGWHRHTTDGNFKWVSVIGGDDEDRIYFMIERVIDGSTVYYIEKLMPKWRESDTIENAFYVDSGLSFVRTAIPEVPELDHLEGKSVVGLADGSPFSGLTVTSGSITLAKAASKVHVGLGYTGYLAPLPFELETQAGSSQGIPRGFGEISLRLHESVGGKIGVGTIEDTVDDIEFDDLQYTPENWGEAIAPFTGIKSLSSPEGYDAGLTVYVSQDQPLPLNVLSIITDVEIEMEE